MKRLVGYLLLATAFASYAPVSAQTADTTDAWRYYPLQIGNVWEYVGYGMEVGSSRFTIVGETTIEGMHYFLERHEVIFPPGGGPYKPYPIRFDAITANVLRRWESGEESVWQFAGCPLNAPFDTEVNCLNGSTSVGGGYAETVELWGGLVLDGVTYKEFYTPPGIFVHGYVAGIGWVLWELGVEPGGRLLRYARIGGIEYGTPFAVSTEGRPPGLATALLVYPNPARDVITLRVMLARPQRTTLAVYDALGRRVLAEDLGALPISKHTHRLDLDALPPGLYVVRLTGDAGASATTRLVIQ